MEEDLMLSYSFDSEGVAAARSTARVHKRSVGIFKQLFNHRFGLLSIRKTRINEILFGIVGTERPAFAEFGWVGFLRVTLARFGMDEDWAAFGVRASRRN